MRADLHIHTYHSPDSEQRIEEVLRAAARLCLGAIAVSDHNSLGGAIETMNTAPPELLVIPAIEVSSAEGHILAYNVTDEVPRDKSAAETIELIHARGGIAVAAHPYRLWNGLGSKVVLDNRFDAIEAMNGRNTERGNAKAIELAQRAHLPMTGGSDAHCAENIGSGLTVFPDDCTTVEDLIRAILDGRTHVEGAGRDAKETWRYGSKSIWRWIGRGMKRI